MKQCDGENAVLHRTWFARAVVAATQIHGMHAGNVEKVQVHFWCKQFIHFECTSAIIQLVSRKSCGQYAPHTLGVVRRVKCCAQALKCCWTWIPCIICAILHRNTLVTLNQFHGAVTRTLCARVQCRRYSTHTRHAHHHHFRFVHFWFHFCKFLRVWKQKQNHIKLYCSSLSWILAKFFLNSNRKIGEN